MGEKPVIGPYREGDEAAINDLYNEVFSEDRPLDRWYWTFRDGPVDSRRFVIVARVGDRVVGQYASLTHRLKYHDRIVHATQPMENMVQADYRGGIGGLQVRMFRQLRKIWPEEQVTSAWGFPNREAYIIGKRLLTYRDMIPIRNLFVLLGAGPVARRLKVPAWCGKLLDVVGRPILRFRATRRARPPRGVTVKRVDGIDERAGELWEKTRDRYPLAVERDLEYLRWRYSPRSGREYRFYQAERGDELLGLSVLRVMDVPPERLGFFMDCIALEESGLVEALVGAGLADLSRAGADFALFRCGGADPIQPALARLGLEHRAGIWNENVVYNTFTDDVVDTEYEVPENWLIRFSDADSL